LIYSISKGSAFTVLEDDKSLKDYCVPMTCFLVYMMRSKEDLNLLQIPLNEKQKVLIRNLQTLLDQNQKDLQTVHDLCYTFSAPSNENVAIGRWSNPLLCFIAIYNLRIDGSMKPILLVPKDFSKWEYLI